MPVSVGIDLGTTFSAVAVVRDGVPVLLQNGEGNLLTPSVIQFRGNTLRQGTDGVQQLLFIADNVVFYNDD